MKSRRWRNASVTVILAAAAGCAGSGAARENSPRDAGSDQTMAYTDITPEEAKKLLDSGGYHYLDVRTVPEFIAGHAPGSHNVPVLEFNAATGGPKMNERFAAIVAAAIPQDANLVVGCKTGARSATACQILARAGYKNLRNIDGGFMGVTNPTGQIQKEGWSTLGYPVERGDGGEKGYEALRGNSR